MKDRDFSGHRRWLLIFSAIAVMVLAQVAWWIYLFVNDVGQHAALRLELATALGQMSDSLRATIERDAFHRRFMFLSESAFFLLLTLSGLFLIYRGWKADQKTRELQRNFIEMVSHESKTPLTAMKLRLEALREKMGQEPEVVREVGLSLDQVTRLSSILEKALNLNRVERHAFQFEPITLSDVVRDVLHRLEPLSRAKGTRVELRFDDVAEPARVWGDSFCLQNSVQNLVENAILYNDSASRLVVIRLRAEAGEVLLSVEDNGPGVSPEDQEKVFERFYRGTRSAKIPGTGLGLYLTRIIVEAHHGMVRLLRSPGTAGAVFEIRLPILKEAMA